ncbi:unnamed protein product [Darwinula stevensoni]|uniref:Uncharacterized protein n=1 Tax=Darwinula stevensoni TaxID=69355 RepID=A0A7R9AD54_9CRUS|nr:unnamed protein product [Darwinula stevensoni]CAG0900742.1 unnamed protein product [Darwinula stevensoni]
MKNIKVVDGREEGLGEDLEALKKFLMETGQGKHVLVDEVPITLGFRGIITSEALSKHWEWVVGSTPCLKSITLSFRPNDQSYERDFPIQDVNPGGREVRVLEGVKRNTRKVAELFLAIGDYARRIFPSLERTLPLNLKEAGEGFKRGFLPVLFSIPSCFSIHPGECRDARTCEAVRALHAIRIVYEERSEPSTPIFVVVDNVERKNAIVRVTASIFPSLPLIFLLYSQRHHAWKFHGHGASEGSSPIVVATESEMTGCHPNNLTIVVDHSGSQWHNYSRLIATTGENKVLVVEEEQLRTGKFSHVTKQIPGWTIKERGVDEDLKSRLNEARSKCDAQRIANLKEEDFPLASFPGMETDWNGVEGEEKRDVEIMLRSSICGIFGPPASGKSLRVSLFIARATERGERVVFLHPGYVLFLEHRRHLVKKDEVDLYESFDSNKVKSFQDVVDLVQEALKEKEGKGKNKKTKKKQGKEKGRETSPLNVVVEDCPLLEELSDTKRLKELTKRLILTFKPHSEDASGKAVGRIIKNFRESPDCTAIVLESQPTNVHLLEHIQKYETGKALKLAAKSLSVYTVPAAIVYGSPVEYIDLNHYKCSGRHLGYLCSGDKPCSTFKAVASCVARVARAALAATTDHQHGEPSIRDVPPSATQEPSIRDVRPSATQEPSIRDVRPSATQEPSIRDVRPSTTREHSIRDVHLQAKNQEPYVLVSDEHLLNSLQSLKSFFDVQVIHSRDFRGCEASVIISVNVNDDWLLEVISRSRTRLIIIDHFPDHEDLWTTMVDEQRVETWLAPSSEDGAANPEFFLTLNEQAQFLKEPTWNDTGVRIGEKALEEGFLDRETGAVLPLDRETWKVLDGPLPLPRSSSPLADWGYSWDGYPGEAPAVSSERNKGITDFLKERGVEWEPAQSPPVALEVRSGGGGGVLDSLSLAVAGSLLHLPLLAVLLEKENQGDPLPLIKRGAELLGRPIVVIGKKLSGTFLPEGDETNDLEGLLLFAQNDSERISFLPVVPRRRSGDSWMKVENLPRVRLGGSLPPSGARISFRGKLKVTWNRHTAIILRSLDRKLAKLPPLSPDISYLSPGSGDTWMKVEKLPRACLGGSLPPSGARISFRGKLKVTWNRHTAIILRSLDRKLAKLPPLGPEVLQPEQRPQLTGSIDKLGRRERLRFLRGV